MIRKNLFYSFPEDTCAAEDYTVYVSAGLVYESNRGSTTYTKHYYAGPLRVASQIGSENPNYETHPLGGQIAPGGPANTTPESYGVAVLSDLNTLLANYGMAVDANEPPQDTLSMQVINDPYECKIFYGDDVIEENRCLCDNFPDIAIQQGINCNPYAPIYWYHPDYIGNIEFVTDRTGQPYQHFYYAAFGDPMVSQHVGTGSFNSAYRFNAKEYDEETGNYYYGARYYEPKSSIWMGVDALATKYPDLSPYQFSGSNPVYHIDPDGQCFVIGKDGEYEPCPDANDGDTRNGHFGYNWTFTEGSWDLTDKNQTPDYERELGVSADGSLDFYEKMYKAHIDTYGTRPPDYYLEYGHKYRQRFHKLGESLSPIGELWNEQTAKRLQVELINMINSDPKIQGNNKNFQKGAYATHVPAYSYNGTISHLPISDLVQIANEPDRTDSYLDFNGLKQMVMMVPKVEPWRAPPGSILGTWYWFNGVR